MPDLIEYGPGGYDPGKPNDNVVAVTSYPTDPAFVNALALTDKAAQALDVNATFLAIASPSNAQTLAQVRSLTRQVNALIRLTLNQLDSTEDT